MKVKLHKWSQINCATCLMFPVIYAQGYIHQSLPTIRWKQKIAIDIDFSLFKIYVPVYRMAIIFVVIHTIINQ